MECVHFTEYLIFRSRLGDSLEQARWRIHQLGQCFQERQYLYQAYFEFMQEYEQLGHINRINEDASGMEEELYYRTHHVILKSSSRATRTRVSWGTNPETLKNCRLWWHGPEWLNQHPKQWPTYQLAKHPEPTPEQHTVKTVKVMMQHFPTELITKFSVLSRLQRIAAYCWDLLTIQKPIIKRKWLSCQHRIKRCTAHLH